MTRTFSLLFLFLFLASCGGGGGGGSTNSSETISSAPDNAIESSEEPSTTPATTQAQTFDIDANLSGFSRTHEEKVMEAIELIKQVVASDEFKKKVLNKTYNGKKAFVDNNGLTNAQIYKKILDGAEKLSPSKNNTMDLHLTTYYVNANVIGYTTPSTKTIFMNRKYLAKFRPYEVAMNLFHEWLHKLGFGHAVNNNSSRPHSVPYAIGYIVRSLAQKYD